MFKLWHFLPLPAIFFYFCRLQLTVTGPIDTLKEELVCLKTLFKNAFIAEQKERRRLVSLTALTFFIQWLPTY